MLRKTTTSTGLGLAGAGDEAALALTGLVGRDVDDADGESVEAKRAEKVLGLGVDLKGRLGRDGEGRDLGNVLVLALTLLLLETERDTTDGTLLDALHKVGGDCRVSTSAVEKVLVLLTASNLVAEALGGDLSDLIEETLVGAVGLDMRKAIPASQRKVERRRHGPWGRSNQGAGAAHVRIISCSVSAGSISAEVLLAPLQS